MYRKIKSQLRVFLFIIIVEIVDPAFISFFMLCLYEANL